ncbi:MAG: N-acetylmuramoyl-L-alanine amidase [Phycisphaerales bacterium]|nr:N-acetylmuramoyl-L-alanine amidase [Phycisphaerales bacterium]MCB9856247.1 N-acetylmuramoyl-L-alanine amidase [Phycisphaerales bacterium]MCB9863314.1 N-acetylmuramoyl-L-alanine amidase [Phycisphaerales bacterium]
MAKKRAKQQNRHYKTLIVLVCSMTIGTFVLYGMARISPAIPLQSRSAASWNRISIRKVADDAPRGFFHFRIDHEGRIFQSRAWDAGQFDRANPGAIQVLLTCDQDDLVPSYGQYESLELFISRLCKTYSIDSERNISVENSAATVADARPHLRRT